MRFYIKMKHQRAYESSINAITICKVIQQLVNKMDFLFSIDVNKIAEKFYFNHFLNDFTDYNCIYQRHVAHLIHDLKTQKNIWLIQPKFS